MDDNDSQDGIVLTDAQKRRRRARSIAIALALGALVLLFFVVTMTCRPFGEIPMSPGPIR